MRDIQRLLGRPEFSPEEEDAIAKEVHEDIRAGQGMRHFQDVFDSLTENHQAQPTHAPDAAESDRIAKQEFELCRDLKLACTRELVSHGMRVLHVKKDGHGTGYLATMKDAENRQYEATITFDEAAKIDIHLKPHEVFREMVGTLVKRALEARRKYFVRACIVVQGEPSSEASSNATVGDSTETIGLRG